MKLFLLCSVLAVGAMADLWYVKNPTKKDSVCAMVESKPKLSIQQGNTSFTLDIVNATVTGTCFGVVPVNDLHHANTMTVAFFPDGQFENATDDTWKLTLYFIKGENQYQLYNWTLEVHPTSKYNVSGLYQRALNSTTYSAAVLHAITCHSLPLNFEDGVQVVLGEARAVAFEDFSAPVWPKDLENDVCPADKPDKPDKPEKPKTSAVVPIIVGCFLVGLVVSVFVAYLIGRHRNRTRGYASV
ncbi:unnamed protein product, partial [Mesorhabditis spiculigera]